LQEYRPGAPGIRYHIAGPFQTGRQRHPGPNWDCEPDEVQVKKGSQIIVTNQGGEPHTFTEVKQLGGGFIPPLNNGQLTVPECNDGFKNLAVTRTRILQGRQLQVGALSKGRALFPMLHAPLDARHHRSQGPQVALASPGG
jgi:hypothetical protein